MPPCVWKCSEMIGNVRECYYGEPYGCKSIFPIFGPGIETLAMGQQGGGGQQQGQQRGQQGWQRQQQQQQQQSGRSTGADAASAD